jgi:hypothetical protein
MLLHRCRAAWLIPLLRTYSFRTRRIFFGIGHDRFTKGFCDCGHTDRASPARLAPAAPNQYRVDIVCIDLYINNPLTSNDSATVWRNERLEKVKLEV